VRATFYLADASALPFGDGVFDYLSISFGIHDKKRNIRNRIVSQLERIVKQKGFLIFIDYQVPLPNNVWAILSRTIEFIAGGSNCCGFRDYIDNGGLKSVLNNHHLLE
jgi:ubiquinone/menaquinone biosynthesis C-methylase UbiE